jgi:hypothetical protein
VTPEPLNTILVVFFLALIALFAAAAMGTLISAVVFLVTMLRYRRFEGPTDHSPERTADAARWLRRGRWGLAGWTALVVFYLLRSWVGELYYSQISQGLVTFSTAWWIVWAASVPYYASVPAGLAGTVAMLMASHNLRRAMRPSMYPVDALRDSDR